MDRPYIILRQSYKRALDAEASVVIEEEKKRIWLGLLLYKALKSRAVIGRAPARFPWRSRE